MAEAPRIAGELLTVSALMSFLMVGVIWYGQSPQAVLPLVAFFFVAVYRLVGAVIQVTSSRIKSLHELHSIHMVQRLIQPAPEWENCDSGAGSLDRLETDIALEDIWYSHEQGKHALEGVTAVIPRGRTTLILGPSGSGKSTLLDVLFRFIAPDKGRISANGRPSTDFSLSSWRNAFGYVSQETAMFNGSIRMNLRIARPEASDGEIERVCRLAGADEFIRSFPQGYETPVGDRGHTLSGGQRKRIAIARVLLRSPSVLILDEATGAIEQSLEKILLQDLRTHFPDLTIIIVTHRPQSLLDIDWAVILGEGKVVRTGPWAELREQSQVLALEQDQKVGAQ